MTLRILLLLLAAAAHQVATDCKNCAMSKDERAMFLAHSASCLPRSGVDQKTIDGLLRGEALDTPELRKHVYCVLLQCKMISKDGKPQKTAALGKMAVGGNAAKMAECAGQSGDTPEDIAWGLFRCGYHMKDVLPPQRSGE